MDATTPLLSAFSALLGAWAGAQVALTRFKRERAFDRRLEWYERMFRSMYALAINLEGAYQYEARGDQEGAEAYWQKAAPQFDALSAVCAERELYAKQRGHDAVSRLLLEVNVVASFEHLRGADRANARYEGAKTIVRLLNEVGIVLSDELRDDLGWRRLRRSAVD